MPVIVEHADEAGVKVQVPDELLHGLDVDRQVCAAVVAGRGSAPEQAVEHRKTGAVVKHPRFGQALDDGQRAIWQRACPVAREQLADQVLGCFTLPV
ncbi:hypothetical protein D3C81_1454710 [compost metagenome]